MDPSESLAEQSFSAFRRTKGPGISNLAPEHVRELWEPLTNPQSGSKPGDAGAIAIKTLKLQLAKHEVTRGTVAVRTNEPGGRLPSLFDAAAATLAKELGEDPEAHLETMQDLPPNVLSKLSLQFENIPYDLLCKLHQGQNQDEGSVDEWVLRNEVWLRHISATDLKEKASTSKRFRGTDGAGTRTPEQPEWHRGMVKLSTHAGIVFSGSELTETCRIITRPTSLSGFKVLDGRRPPAIRIQPSVDMFAKTFETMTGGLLNGLDWDHVFVAGGIVLGAMSCTEGKDATNAPEQWKSSDVDLYIYGMGPVEANKKIDHIFSVFKGNLPQDAPVLVVRNSKTITFFSEYPLRRIQVVLKLVKSPKDVLLNFDLDICAIGWDGKEVWMLPRAARALETGYTVFTMDLINGHYLGDRRATQEQRVFKYADKGYGIRILPSYLKEHEIIGSDPEKQKALGIHNEGHWDLQEFDELVDAARNWTASVVTGKEDQGYTSTFSHAWLQDRKQNSEDPPGRSCLSSLNLFMRHVALWEHEVAGDIAIEKDTWAASTYDTLYSDRFGIGYNDTPDYSWNKHFNINDFISRMSEFNRIESDGLRMNLWRVTIFDEDTPRASRGYSSLNRAQNSLLEEGIPTQRIVCANSVQEILRPECDICLPIWLPVTFIDFANDLIPDTVRKSGVPEYSAAMFIKALKDNAPASRADSEGLRPVIWRITNVTMWQQLNRTIDEIHEILWSFHHANAALHLRKEEREQLLVSQFSKRAIRLTVQDEHAAFARWVARKPARTSTYYNSYLHDLDLDETDDETEEEL